MEHQRGRPARVAYNTLVRNGATANGYFVADIAGDSRLQNSADLSVFFTDAIHLNKAGGFIKRQIDDAAIESAFA